MAKINSWNDFQKRLHTCNYWLVTVNDEYDAEKFERISEELFHIRRFLIEKSANEITTYRTDPYKSPSLTDQDKKFIKIGLKLLKLLESNFRWIKEKEEKI